MDLEPGTTEEEEWGAGLLLLSEEKDLNVFCPAHKGQRGEV
jgi:hypothetical protein